MYKSKAEHRCTPGNLDPYPQVFKHQNPYSDQLGNSRDITNLHGSQVWVQVTITLPISFQTSPKTYFLDQSEGDIANFTKFIKIAGQVQVAVVIPVGIHVPLPKIHKDFFLQITWIHRSKTDV